MTKPIGPTTNLLAVMSAEDYHKTRALNSSAFSDLEKSEEHYFAKYLDPQREPDKPSDEMDLGTAVHQAVLEPKLFVENYIVIPTTAPKKPTKAQLEAKSPSDKTIESIAWWDAFYKENKGAKFISLKDFEVVTKIALMVRSHPTASAIFNSGVAERSVFWKDERTGVLCKARLDFISDEFSAVIDLKTARDASARGFARAVRSRGYHRQAAWYMEAYTQVYGKPPKNFIWAVWETSPPYAVAFYSPHPADLERARGDILILKDRYARALETNVWRGYPEEIQVLRSFWSDDFDGLADELESF